jgi:hypothetical protein
MKKICSITAPHCKTNLESLNVTDIHIVNKIYRYVVIIPFTNHYLLKRSLREDKKNWKACRDNVGNKSLNIPPNTTTFIQNCSYMFQSQFTIIGLSYNN